MREPRAAAWRSGFPVGPARLRAPPGWARHVSTRSAATPGGPRVRSLSDGDPLAWARRAVARTRTPSSRGSTMEIGSDRMAVVKTYRPYAPNQPYLLPPSPSEWLPEGHLAYFILDLLEDINLQDIERVLQAKDPRGERPFSPRMMTALWLYGYAVGVTS